MTLRGGTRAASIFTERLPGATRGGRMHSAVFWSRPMDIIIDTVEAFVLAGVLGVASLATAGVLHIG